MYSVYDESGFIGISRWPSVAGQEPIDMADPDVVAFKEIEAEVGAKNIGFEYNGVSVPVTNEDALGALQLEAGFERMGMQATVFHLSNGEKIQLSLEDWAGFKIAFFTFRASFFTE